MPVLATEGTWNSSTPWLQTLCTHVLNRGMLFASWKLFMEVMNRKLDPENHVQSQIWTPAPSQHNQYIWHTNTARISQASHVLNSESMTPLWMPVSTNLLLPSLNTKLHKPFVLACPVSCLFLTQMLTPSSASVIGLTAPPSNSPQTNSYPCDKILWNYYPTVMISFLSILIAMTPIIPWNYEMTASAPIALEKSPFINFTWHFSRIHFPSWSNRPREV